MKYAPPILALLAVAGFLWAGFGAGISQNAWDYLQVVGLGLGSSVALTASLYLARGSKPSSKDLSGVADCVNSLTRITLWASERKHEALVASAGIAIDECHKINLDDDVPA